MCYGVAGPLFESAGMVSGRRLYLLVRFASSLELECWPTEYLNEPITMLHLDAVSGCDSYQVEYTVLPSPRPQHTHTAQVVQQASLHPHAPKSQNPLASITKHSKQFGSLFSKQRVQYRLSVGDAVPEL